MDQSKRNTRPERLPARHNTFTLGGAMKFRHGVLVTLRALVVCVLPALLMPSGASAQSPDPFQRYIVFYNSLPTTIYPVIQAPNKGTSNCGTAINGLMRIVVNKDVENAGIPSGQSVTVAIPKDALCPGGAFYGAVRIYVLECGVQRLRSGAESRLANSPRIPAGTTPSIRRAQVAGSASLARVTRRPSLDRITATIYRGNSSNTRSSRRTPRPARISPMPTTAAAGRSSISMSRTSTTRTFPSPWQRAMAAPRSSWAARWDPTTITTRASPNSFRRETGRCYGDFAPLNWASSAECPNPKGRPTNTLKTSFSCLVPRTDVVPSAAILISNTRSGGASSLLSCRMGRHHPAAMQYPRPPIVLCAVALPSVELCCPDVNNVMQGCCDQDHFLIDRSHRSYVSGPVSKPVWKYDNKTLDVLVDRFKGWQGGNNPCTDPESPAVAAGARHRQAGFLLGL